MDNNFQMNDLAGLSFVDDTGFRLKKEEIDRIRKELPDGAPFYIRLNPETDLPIAFICKQMNCLTGTHAIYPPFAVFYDTTTIYYLTTGGHFILTIDKQTKKLRKLDHQPTKPIPQNFTEEKMLAFAKQRLNLYIPSDRQPIRNGISEPNQKTHRDYGLPKIEALPDSSFAEPPKLLPKAESGNLAQAQVIRAIPYEGNNSSYIVCTPLGKVVIKKELLKHVSENRLALREQYANFILPVLTNPNEIWLTEYSDGFRYRFIKLFKGKRHMLVIVKKMQTVICFGMLYQQNQDI